MDYKQNQYENNKERAKKWWDPFEVDYNECEHCKYLIRIYDGKYCKDQDKCPNIC